MDIPSFLIGKKAGGGPAPTPIYQDKEITITQNGEQTITADSGYDALSSVEITTNVPQPSGKITITENGTDIDVSNYATADVNVSGSISVPTNLNELNTLVNNSIDSFLNYVQTTEITSRTAYTNESVNLYTPDIDCKNYVIRYRNNAYSVVWLNGTGIYINSGAFYRSGFASSSSTNTLYTNGKLEQNQRFNYSPNSDNSGAVGYYSNETFTTPEEVINAMINNQLTYSTGTFPFGYASNKSISGYEFPYSNGFIAMRNQYTLENSRVISHNETIVAMS